VTDESSDDVDDDADETSDAADDVTDDTSEETEDDIELVSALLALTPPLILALASCPTAAAGSSSAVRTAIDDRAFILISSGYASR